VRLFDAIIEANHRAVAGDNHAGLHLTDFSGSLPIIALTCIDPRLNKFFPGILALPEDQFIWLRNAGNHISSPIGSTMRSLALALAIKGGREIAIIGHTDCAVRKTTVSHLTDRLKDMGVERRQLPENLVQYFGLFASEPQNVITSVEFVRKSPLIGPTIPVHGLMVDTDSGKLSWVVNGYQTLEHATSPAAFAPSIAAAADAIGQWANRVAHTVEDLKPSQIPIGQAVPKIGESIPSFELPPQSVEPPPPPLPAPAAPPAARPIPIPPRISVLSSPSNAKRDSAPKKRVRPS
jgi:carbonic anhydrase